MIKNLKLLFLVIGMYLLFLIIYEVEYYLIAQIIWVFVSKTIAHDILGVALGKVGALGIFIALLALLVWMVIYLINRFKHFGKLIISLVVSFALAISVLSIYYINIEKQKVSNLVKAKQYLLESAVGGDLKVLLNVIKSGADINSEYKGYSALYYATGNGYLDVVKYLVGLGADINYKNGPDKQTALHEAALRGRYRIAEYLILHGANVDARNNDDLTPMEYMTTPPYPMPQPENYIEIKELLEKH